MSEPEEIKAEAAALKEWAYRRDIQFPTLYESIATEFQALFLGEGAAPFGNFGRWVHEQPVAMFVFRVDASQPLRRPGRSVEGNASDLCDAITQLVPSRLEALSHALVPFSGQSHGWFCFDMSFETGPPVVFLDPERDWQASPSSGLRYVADSFEAFLERLEYPNEHGEYATLAGSSHVASPSELSWDLHRDRSLFGLPPKDAS